MPSKLIDLTGKKFGKWTVSRHSHVTKKANGSTVHHWLCKCECGSERTVTGDSLNKGNSKSCGCINRQLGRNHPSWQGYEDISASFWKQYQWSAAKRNLSFDITMEYLWRLYLKQNKKCALTGLPLTFPKDARDTTHNASLDRIDPKGGYFEGNVQWVDKRVNFMKITLRNEEFIELCKLVAKNENVF
jgi:hypothetical protein